MMRYAVKGENNTFRHQSICCLHFKMLVKSREYRNHITKTSPCNEHPLTPHFYIVKLGFTGVYIFSYFLLQNIDCGYSLEPPQYPQSMF